MSLVSRAAALLGAALLLGTAGGAEALPVAPSGAGLAAPAGLEQAAYLHHRYPGYHSRSARRFRHARRLSPNKFCRNQPSRCR